MRPVPCPRRRELLRAQLSTCGYTSDSTILLHSNEPTVSHLSIGVTARSASALLNVEGTAVASSADGVSLGVSLTKRSGTLGLQRGYSNSKTKNTRMHRWNPLPIALDESNPVHHIPFSKKEYSNTFGFPERVHGKWLSFFVIKDIESLPEFY